MSPNNTRGELIRHADEATNDLKRADDNLTLMAETYGETHPDYRDACLALKEIVEQAAMLLLQFRDRM